MCVLLHAYSAPLGTLEGYIRNMGLQFVDYTQSPSCCLIFFSSEVWHQRKMILKGTWWWAFNIQVMYDAKLNCSTNPSWTKCKRSCFRFDEKLNRTRRITNWILQMLHRSWFWLVKLHGVGSVFCQPIGLFQNLLLVWYQVLQGLLD